MKTGNKNLINSGLMTYNSRAKYLLLIMILMGWAGGCVSFPVQAETISFKGTIIPQTCELSVNGQPKPHDSDGGIDNSYNVTFDGVQAGELKNNKYVESSGQELKLRLSNCDPLAENQRPPVLYIWGEVPDAGTNTDGKLFMSSRISVINSTKGVGVRLRDDTLGANQFVDARPQGNPYRIDLSIPTDKDGKRYLNGVERTFTAYIGGVGGAGIGNQAECNSDSKNMHVLCGGSMALAIHFEFAYQ
ncbi:fimbrial protein [Photorhabdus sp. CRCIA-P01]|uniref:fimbrial protein n=1 Tax=Photorhabdus sp. CRCIA-P01 TaxID=2019570 RepID=UPI000E59EE2C|nr:type 1 fimbrial protein [Photorhabdus sp. CRCIA-P01]